MTLDATARNLADNLTNRFGKTIQLKRTLQNVYDPSAGVGGDDQIPNTYTVKVTPPKNFMLKRIDGTLIEEGDEIVSLPALNSPVVPDQETDVIIYGGEVWTIKQIGKLYGGELVAMYILHLTK